jgi:hypothetical protein
VVSPKVSIKRHHVRATGCTLVWLGFAWLLVVQFSIRPIARALVVQRYETIDQNKEFSADDVRKQVLWSTFELVDRMPLIVTPGIVMALGAILVDAARRFRD